MILLLKMASKCSAKVLFESRKSVMCLPEKIHMLDKLHSGMSYSTVGWEFSVNESRYDVSREGERKFTDLYVRLLWKLQK